MRTTDVEEKARKIAALAADPGATEGERQSAEAALERLQTRAAATRTRKHRRPRGTGCVRERGNAFEVRYSWSDPVTGKRRVATTTVRGSRKEAEQKLRERLKDLDDHVHVDPNKITVALWIAQWLASLEVRARTAERYAQLLNGHVVPVLGGRRLQSIEGTDLDALYSGLKGKISDRTRHHVHVVLGTCLRAAVRKKKLKRNPIEDANAPKVEEKVEGEEVGIALNSQQLAKLDADFAGHPLSLFVATANETGSRRNEMLAFRWPDFDPAAKHLRVVRALEEPKENGRRVRKIKAPKTKQGTRTITISDRLVKLLLAEREKHQRVIAGVPDGATADVSLVKLPDGALIFPAPGGDLCKFRDANAVTRTFIRRARKSLGLGNLRLHDLRHTHGSRLIAACLPITTVAARLGHSPEVLLRIYAHEIKAVDEKRSSADVIAALAVS
jgi:integrase